MTTISDYMDAARKRAALPSDRSLASYIGVSEAAPSTWRRGIALPTPTHMVHLAKLAGMDPDRALLDLAIVDSEKQGCTDIAARYRSIAARIAVGLFAPLLIYTAIEGEERSQNNVRSNIPDYLLCESDRGENSAPNCQGSGRLALSPPADGMHTCVLTGRTPDKGFLTVYTL